MLRFFLILIYLLFIVQSSFAGSLKTVVVASEGVGSTREDSINSAIVEAISQVNGAAVASTMAISMSEAYTETSSGSEYTAQESIQKNIAKATEGVVSQWKIVSIGQNPDMAGLWEAFLEVSVSKYEQSKQLKRLRMAVSEFRVSSTGSSEDLNIFQKAFVRELENYLTQTRRFAMLDRSFLSEQDAELDLLSSGGSPTQELARLGQRAGTDYIIVGEVVNASKSSSKRTMKSTGQSIMINKAKGRVDYRIIDVATSQTKFASSSSGEVASLSIGGAARQAARKAGEKVLNSIFPIRVIDFQGSFVTLGQGGDTLRKGDQYKLIKLGKKMVDPYTKESLGRAEDEIGIIMITDVQAKQTTASITKISLKIPKNGPLPLMIARPFKKVRAEDKAAANVKRESESGLKKLDSLLETSKDDW
jgi:hypothetical protein